MNQLTIPEIESSSCYGTTGLLFIIIIVIVIIHLLENDI